MSVYFGYKNYLRTKHWKRRRSVCMERRGELCLFCLSGENIHIHHRKYTDKNGQPIFFKEPAKQLVPLCKKCHYLWHKYHGYQYLVKDDVRRAQSLYLNGYSRDEVARFCTEEKIVRIAIKETRKRGKAWTDIDLPMWNIDKPMKVIINLKSAK